MVEHAGHTVVLMNVPDELSVAKRLAVPQELTGKPYHCTLRRHPLARGGEPVVFSSLGRVGQLFAPAGRKACAASVPDRRSPRLVDWISPWHR